MRTTKTIPAAGASPAVGPRTNVHDGCFACVRTRRQFVGLSTTALAALVGLPLTGRILEASAVQSNGDQHSYAIPASDGVTIDKATQVILVRQQGKVFVFNLSCPHENTALRWRNGDKRFQCPKHESKYQPDGTFTSGRATRHMDRFAVTRDGSSVVANLAVLYQSDKQPAEWAAAFVAV
ncbi:MAG: ubiquinol-cytochrome c reductase iron-sulfur subunit [Vicinamibacterales bacterium]